jgi:hypothetical protein
MGRTKKRMSVIPEMKSRISMSELTQRGIFQLWKRSTTGLSKYAKNMDTIKGARIVETESKNHNVKRMIASHMRFRAST